jgi:hypothetical protein
VPDDEDIFKGSFRYLEQKMAGGTKAEQLVPRYPAPAVQQCSGGILRLERLKGDKGEVALHCGTSEDPFGLIYVGSAKELCDHIAELAAQEQRAHRSVMPRISAMDCSSK